MKQASEWSYVDHYELYKRIKPESLPTYLREHRSDLLDSRRPFAEYMRKKLKEKRMLQQDVTVPSQRSNRGLTIYHGDSSYITYVKWEDFAEAPQKYIDKACEIQTHKDDYTIAVQL